MRCIITQVDNLDFVPFTMAHTPLKMTIEEADAELNYPHIYSNEYTGYPEASVLVPLHGAASPV